MTTKTKLAIVAVALLASFAFGRWGAPEKVRTETKIIEVEKKTSDTETDKTKKRKKKTVIVEVTSPDGTKTKTTTISDDTTTDTASKSHEVDDIVKNEDKKTEVTRSESKTTLSALGGMKLGSPIPVYGVSAYRPVLGPLGIGIWGLNNSTFGASVGISL